ncbi:hypothetical protein [Puerhibacterium puerhi]|uniref:hypothetical protein n=1 Tax=Puerhibacterium puerhi TaxID=2692623 RepID=UPI00135B8EE5|nr:hypothetical protein [Puerhibacterium puerhi]
MDIMTSSQHGVPPAPPAHAPTAPAHRATAVRWLAAVAAVVSAAVHLVLWFDGYRTIPGVGPLFLLQAVAGVVLAVLLVTWRHWLPPLGALGYGVATLAAYLLSLTVGFLGVHEPEVEPTAVVAGVAEVVVAVAGAVALVRERRG